MRCFCNHRTRRLIFAVSMALAMMMAGMFGTAHAYIYEYTGNPFTNFFGSDYTTHDYLAFNITSDVLLPKNLPLEVSDPTQWISLDSSNSTLNSNDGVHQLTLTMGSHSISFVLTVQSTDTDGLPSHWALTLDSSVSILYNYSFQSINFLFADPTMPTSGFDSVMGNLAGNDFSILPRQINILFGSSL